MAHINIEIKAECPSHEYVRQVLTRERARFQGTDHQIDTYFNCKNGRLKLREGNIENFLVHYQREDKQGPKQSNVTLFKSEPGSSLKDLLTQSLGVLVVVDKSREIYWVDNVKFHLDIVVNLGSFVEIEAIDYDGTIGRDELLEQCQHYLQLFQIPPQALIARSYSDLLLEKN